MTKTLNDFIRHTVLLALGGAICALAVKGILIPQWFLSRGLTGAALIVYYKYPVLSVGAIYLLLNIPVFALGWRFVGLRFVLYSLWGMAIYSGMLYLMTFRIEISDKMLSAVIAGGLSGIGVAVILYSVISRKNVSSLKKVVLDRDPRAFIALMTAEDVTGMEVGNQPHW